MEFQVTAQRQAYLAARGRIILNACPGSGKTTCIVHKLASLQIECLQLYGRHAGIACLSFTNVAKHEIISKYKKLYGLDLDYPHLVSTIDSFFNQYITLPFYNLLNKDFKRPKIVDENSVIDNAFKIYYRKNGILNEGIIYPLNTFKNRQGRALYRSYPPSTIWVDVNGKFSFEGKTPDSATVDPTVFQEYGSTVLTAKMRKGLITSLDSAFIALHLVNKHERIGQWLAKRFPYLIVDEAQDNSEIQHAIFDKLISLGLSNIEMIGDPYQSLYEWRDAKPQLFLQKYSDATWIGLPLSQNRRSVQRIIDCFSIVRHPNDEAITTIDVHDLGIPVFVYKYDASNPALIVRHFEKKCAEHNFTKNHIVVRGHGLRNKMLGNTSDVNPWKTMYPSRLLRTRHHFESNEVKDAVNELRRFIIELQNPLLDYTALQDLYKNLKDDYTFNGRLYAFLYTIPGTALSFEQWTADAITALWTSFGIDATTTFLFKRKIVGQKMTLLKQQSVNVFFNKPASNQYNIPITTIHQVKGATLDAILYFFDEDSTGQSVSFKDFKQSTGFPTEKQRMIYVACSRPKQLLALAFPEKVSDEDIQKKFGSDVRIENLKQTS
ncbi:MAG TPA: ATP-dependent helicase [Chitinophagaceae bacterium]|nr:ATP-dependent helicase [Chitinophagaceae bacterium]